MELQRAMELLRSLADGNDPYSGAPLPEDHVCNRPEMIRAFHCLLEFGQDEATRMENAGRPWTAEEEALLLSEVDSGLSMREISRMHRRSPSAVNARVLRLMKQNDQLNFLRGR